MLLLVFILLNLFDLTIGKFHSLKKDLRKCVTLFGLIDRTDLCSCHGTSAEKLHMFIETNKRIRNLCNSSKSSWLEVSGLEIRMEPAKRAEIEALISENNISEVANELEKNPELLLQNRKLIKKARTPLMVETLLQLNLLSTLVDSGKPGSSALLADNSERRETILRAIKATFYTILKRWPNLAVRVLDKHVSYRGQFLKSFQFSDCT